MTSLTAILPPQWLFSREDIPRQSRRFCCNPHGIHNLCLIHRLHWWNCHLFCKICRGNNFLYEWAVGRAVASDTRRPQFEYSHQQILYAISTVLKRRKKKLGIAQFLKNFSTRYLCFRSKIAKTLLNYWRLTSTAIYSHLQIRTWH